MNDKTVKLLRQQFRIDEDIVELVQKAEAELADEFKAQDEIMEYNQYKVLKAFQENRISDMHFGWTTGYGYDDMGRAAIERVYASVFNAEAAIVRTQIVNGTHALASVYLGLLRSGDELIYCSGTPYDTMKTVIGLDKDNLSPGNLQEYGIKYSQVELTEDGEIDLEAVKAAIKPTTTMAALQRSTGYSFRRAFTTDRIKAWIDACRSVKPDIILMVDNCYGEFTDYEDPIALGADIMAGSLIKNPGGGLALSGGYIAGRKDLIDKIYYRVTCPGIGGECGLTFGQTRTMMQGLFIAPRVTNGAVKGAKLCARVYENLGYKTCPHSTDRRSDIIEAVVLGSAGKVEAFCKGVQQAAPVDSFVTPEYGDMAGYRDKIIMAAGAFVQGSSIELSADGPMREPYIVYFQGGITYEHSKFGVIKSLQALKDAGLL
ncbi:MAG: methionine gamma-lyase family protein [Firmicutes bacterium]|nr:methionine gamma-lyase family protein [Bacillota bacterium]